MPLSWNEIRSRAIAFSNEFETESSEDAEAKTFWDSFFNVFGVTRRRIASFEQPVTKSDGKGGYIDLLWKGVLLVEHKSRGKDLDRAFHQATDYFYGLKERDLPRYVLVSDFARFRLYDLEASTAYEFPLQDLHKHIKQFGFVAGYTAKRFDEHEEAANIKAAEQLGKLHDQLKAAGYEGHPLEVLLVRLLFCLFADDTGIFEKNQCKEYLEQRTAEDGSDLGMHLAHLFQVLNTPHERRQKKLDELLAEFNYVNGRLFEETLPIPAFDKTMRETLLDAFSLDWSRISPAIFGSLFQSIMDEKARRNLGAHYTRESNILKALRPLFLDELADELTAIGSNSKRLVEFQKKLAGIRVLDPACGCGNFLVIAYREIRRLELEVLHRLHKKGASSRTLDVKSLVFVDVDQFYGIEIEEFPAQIAQVALWLTDHQMNQLVSEEFGQYFARLPLTKSPNIVYGNALRIDWATVVDPATLNYIVGNPPFIGAMVMSEANREDMAVVFDGVKGYGVLDYVAAWYLLAAKYLARDLTPGRIRCAFVSTNSIVQGEQVGLLWHQLLPLGIKISFAHRTFKWSNEARGVAAVHCVIIGFAIGEAPRKCLYEYDEPTSDPHLTQAKNISPYLVDATDLLLSNREQPLCDVPSMRYGNMPRDDGQLLLSDDEKRELERREPAASAVIRPFMSAREFLNDERRWCLWLKDVSPTTLRGLPEVMKRVENVRRFRLASKAASTRRFAASPGLFAQIAQPTTSYLLVPRHSSESRRYIPFGFFTPDHIVADSCLFVPDATLYHFGVMSSEMHMAWVRSTCGRIKSDYRYSKDVVYNNFPWPAPTDAQRKLIEAAAQKVLDRRLEHSPASLADLYDPLATPPSLVAAHQGLDRAVDAAYRRAAFSTEAERVAYLFERYRTLSAPLIPEVPKTVKRKRAPASR